MVVMVVFHVYLWLVNQPKQSIVVILLFSIVISFALWFIEPVTNQSWLVSIAMFDESVKSIKYGVKSINYAVKSFNQGSVVD